tara:strand:+ start:74 stop:490 length:417 start_codon:yes stop_codon:yes gene_type:complete
MLIGGVSGSGKTGVAEFLTANLVLAAKRFSADDFFSRNGKYQFQPELLSEAHNQCLENVSNNMQEDCPVIIVDNTFTTEWELSHYFDLAEHYEYEVIYLAAVNHHGNKDVHNVPYSSITKQVTNLLTTIKDLSLKPYK